VVKLGIGDDLSVMGESGKRACEEMSRRSELSEIGLVDPDPIPGRLANKPFLHGLKRGADSVAKPHRAMLVA
jgi:hypothetical protein